MQKEMIKIFGILTFKEIANPSSGKSYACSLRNGFLK